MEEIKVIFENLGKIIKTEDNKKNILSILTEEQDNETRFQHLSDFLYSIIKEINKLATEIKTNNDVLISVKDQQLLRTCFEVIISFGVYPNLIPGLGVSLTKRCATAQLLPTLPLHHAHKYEIFTTCTDFIHRCYDIPVLKNIIITSYLSDYLAALIQLAFAPLKKPGLYNDFIMTREMYEKYSADNRKYKEMYEYLVANCVQPMLMKELLVLLNVPPPAFAKRVIATEMSRRLTSPGGLLSLIRCFLENHHEDTGQQWRKIDMICRIICKEHCNMNENDYITNICSQLKQILSLNNDQYLTIATSCLLSLYEKYHQCDIVKNLAISTFQPFNYHSLLNKTNLPGIIIMTTQDIEHNVLLLNSYVNITKFESHSHFLSSNIYILFLLSMKCNKKETRLLSFINNIILKGFESMDKNEINAIIEQILFGIYKEKSHDICIEVYKAGLTIKFVSASMEHPVEQAVQLFIDIFNMASSSLLVSNLFEATLQMLMNINDKRKIQNDKGLMGLEDNPVLINSVDERYMNTLHILSEISSSKKVLSSLKKNPVIVVTFVEKFILKSIHSSNDECVTVALVLLNTILANTDKSINLKHTLHTLLSPLRKLANDQSNMLSILCKETISLILSEYPKQMESAYQKALTNVYDDLLPVRAHGVMELTKLIDAADPETISKRHFLFCLFQEQLKDSDSYMYLSAINGVASLATHCTDDVIAILCKEYLNTTYEEDNVQTLDQENQVAELRMKIGDIIVKVTRRLGDMAVVHKNILLNTTLCGCRDDDPLLRASALSNLAEIALVLHYKIGTIIHEVLLCIHSIIETDKAIECRRAAVMVIRSLLKGMGKDALVELKEVILPIYRTLNKLYKDEGEDSVMRLHAQLALEEINDLVKQFLHYELPMEKQFSLLNQNDIRYK